MYISFTDSFVVSQFISVAKHGEMLQAGIETQLTLSVGYHTARPAAVSV